MRILFFIGIILSLSGLGQAPPPVSASQIYQQIEKLKVLGSVLYVAAHPDDENTRLIAYLANDKLYRTGYLSITRGDGGQNLIGVEQGVELGLIRTQELLAARRIDGGEQFFTRAYDFGYSKNPEETFEKWHKEKILSDVVWVIRKFQPDVIITRFPTTGEGGHGHHTASAILANEAFEAAADSKRFPEQLKFVKPWKAKRILWNTFNFGGNNTTNASQFHINVGGYNTLLGKSYGEIAAQSRSQHKSQGFGVASTRGESFEYFKTTGGDAPVQELTDGIITNWLRIGKKGENIEKAIQEIKINFDETAPQKSVQPLVALYKTLKSLSPDFWVEKKKLELQQIIAACSGLYIDFTSNQPYAVQTGNLEINASINNRLGTKATLKNIQIEGVSNDINSVLEANKNFSFTKAIPVPMTKELTQPYWLKEKMEDGAFVVENQQLIGVPDVQPAYKAAAVISIEGEDFVFEQAIRYKHTDPVRGELYQPLYVVPPATITNSPQVLIFSNAQNTTQTLQTQLHANIALKGDVTTGLTGIDFSGTQRGNVNLEKGLSATYQFKVTDEHKPTELFSISSYANKTSSVDTTGYYLAMRGIDYDHIPSIRYFYPDFVTALNLDLKIAGKKIGYIAGAGDKVPAILERMGYDVVFLNKESMATTVLSQFDAIITGVRAYNTNEWMGEVNAQLMNYVKEGGNMIVQYNTNSFAGKLNANIGPYPFTITRNRITNENAKVTILDAKHSLFNYPNRITEKDFEGWVQERSIYHAGNWGDQYKALLSMADPGEKADEGSLITTKYGKGNFTYTGLVFFRDLPAAVPGAIRLMANLIALNKQSGK